LGDLDRQSESESNIVPAYATPKGLQTAETTTIKTPLKLQIRRLRYQVLPVLIFAIALVLTAYLWKNYAGAPHGYGEVHAVFSKVNAPKDGTLMESDAYPKQFDRVDKDQILVRFSASDLIEQEAQLQDTVKKTQDELSAAQVELEKATKAGTEKAKLDPLKQQVSTLTARLDEERKKYNHVKKQVEAANLKAPMGGIVTEIKHQPGEFVKQGQEIMTITQENGAYITTYVRAGSGLIPTKDMRVTVRSQNSQKSERSIVQEVGAQIELIPEHQLANPKKPEWGIPVRIAMPPNLQLRPGELVVLNYVTEK